MLDEQLKEKRAEQESGSKKEKDPSKAQMIEKLQKQMSDFKL